MIVVEDAFMREHEKLVQEQIEKLQHVDCTKLLNLMLETPMSFIYEACDRLLRKRGHKIIKQ